MQTRKVREQWSTAGEAMAGDLTGRGAAPANAAGIVSVDGQPLAAGSGSVA